MKTNFAVHSSALSIAVYTWCFLVNQPFCNHQIRVTKISIGYNTESNPHFSLQLKVKRLHCQLCHCLAGQNIQPTFNFLLEKTNIVLTCCGIKHCLTSDKLLQSLKGELDSKSKGFQWNFLHYQTLPTNTTNLLVNSCSWLEILR